LQTIDWVLIFSYFVLSLLVGFWVAKKGNKNTKDYFTANGKISWWLLGVSMVATTFSTDTPNLVTDIVRQNGVSGNWVWWAMLLTGMLTVFIYARLWKKIGVVTDVEFYELRYSGKAAKFLRGFRAIYLGLVFNVMIMASVSLAAIKIGSALLGLSPIQTVLIAGIITVIYSSLGGLKSVLITDFIQFFLAIAGALIAAYYALNHPKVDGLSKLLSHENVSNKLSLIPSISNPEILVTIFVIPLLVQWWSTWYPGAEPGGGGYIAQRMIAAKDEKHAIKAVFFFNIAHYAIRPWPWIIVALSSLVIFPTLESLKQAFPHAEAVINHDMAYPAMLSFIPTGLLGLVITSLVAAYMSTISTHLNWGASYLVNDFYKRFVKPSSSEKELMLVSRFATILLMIFAMLFALLLENALDAFQILLQIGAGTGLIFILRWFWVRINAASEITAMLVSFFVAVYFKVVHSKLNLPELENWQQILIGNGIKTVSWVLVALLTKPTEKNHLEKFNQLIGKDKNLIRKKIPIGLLCMLLGSAMVYLLLLGTGKVIYGELLTGITLFLVSVICSLGVLKLWKHII